MIIVDLQPFPVIKTARLILRALTLTDSQAILSLRGNEDAMHFIGRPRLKTTGDSENFINVILDSVDRKESVFWAIALNNAPDELIGHIGYWRLLQDHARAEIGYMLHPVYWQKGFMKEAIIPVIKYGFTRMKLHSIEANINPDNKSSAALLFSAGFEKCGHIKENFFFDGIYYDTAIFSLLSKL